jgi:ABC-type sugar transport system ATPase subunit
MARIELDHVSKVYPGGVPAVNDLTLDVPDGDFMVLVGPSGSGKSTALRMIAGLEDVTAGTIRIGDRVVNDLPPKDRDIAMVFQNYALYPHMTVAENLAFGLQLHKTPKQEQARRVAEAARMLALEPFLERKPAALSGGQRQRVAMGRAIVRDPQAFLMDEPLSNLDAKLRVSTRAQLAALHDRLGVTTIYVTHDQIEAMTLGTRVAVLKDGELQQVDSPQNLFDAPANLFVATFIGSPAMNLADAKLVKDGGLAVVFADYKIPVPERAIARASGAGAVPGPAGDRRAASLQRRGCGVRAAGVATDQGRGRGDREAGQRGRRDLPGQGPAGAARGAGRPVRQGGQGQGVDRRGAGRRPGGRGCEPVDRQGQPQDQRPAGPRHRPGRRRLGPVLVRPRQRPGHRPVRRRRPARRPPGRHPTSSCRLISPMRTWV